MCLAIPTRVVELLPDNQALVDLGGVRKAISLELVDDVAVGDYVIIHVGYALTRLDPDEAARTLALMAEAGLDVGGAAAEAARESYAASVRDGQRLSPRTKYRQDVLGQDY